MRHSWIRHVLAASSALGMIGLYPTQTEVDTADHLELRQWFTGTVIGRGRRPGVMTFNGLLYHHLLIAGR